jgi:hypothetical protein
MTAKAKHTKSTLRAESRPSQLSGGARKLNPQRQAGKGRVSRNKRRVSSRWRRLVKWALLAVLAGPALVMLVYSVMPPPLTPLMLIRALEGEEIDYRWTPLEHISPRQPLL